jgi:signal transduction histidine kinase
MADHALIEDSAGEKLFVKLDPGCEACLRQCNKASEVVSDCVRPGRRRRGRFDALLGSVFLCTDAEDDIRSAKRFRSRIEVMGGAIQLLLDARDSAQQAARRDAKRITHNLRTLCSRISLEVYSIASQEQIVAETDGVSQMRVLRDALLEEPDETASVLLRVLKNCQAMAHEFSVFERLDSSRLTDIRPMPHVLHRVVRNVVAFFFQDFQSSGITVRQSPSDTRVKLDYETFSVAMYYILDNATKYCAHGSHLNIRFETNNGLRLLLEMTSLQVDPDEADKIFDEHYSGRTARLVHMNGNGIGMYLSKRLLFLSGIGIRFIPGPLVQSSLKNAGYAYNTIEISFPRNLIADDSARKRPSRRSEEKDQLS